METSEHNISWNEKLNVFYERSRQVGLKITPQRLAVYKALIQTDTHPTAEEVYQMVRQELPNISLDTVNRTLLTPAENEPDYRRGDHQPRRRRV